MVELIDEEPRGNARCLQAPRYAAAPRQRAWPRPARIGPRYQLSLAALAVALAAALPARAATFTVTDQPEFDAAMVGATAPGNHVVDINDPLAITPNPYDPTILLTRNASLTLPGAATPSPVIVTTLVVSGSPVAK